MSADKKPQTLSRRRWLQMVIQGSAAAGAASLLAACGGATPPNTGQTNAEPTAAGAGAAPTAAAGAGAATTAPAVAASTTTLQFVTPGALGLERTMYENFVYKFQEANPDIKVNVSFEAWGDYMTKLPTLLASGAVPDVIHQHMSIVQDYAGKGALLDLTPLMQKDNVSKDMYIPALFDAFSASGKTYALPKDSAAWGMYYNKTMFDEAKVAYPSDDWTIEDFRRIALELTRDANGNNASSPSFDRAYIKQWGFNWQEPTPVAPTNVEVPRGFLKAFGGDWYNEDYSETLITQQPALDYFRMMAEMRCKDGSTPAASQAVAQGDPFRTGLTAMAVGFHVTDFFCRQENVKFAWDVTYLPKGPGGQYVVVGASGWAIPAQAKNPEASWRFVRYLTSEAVQKSIGEQKRWGVSLKQAVDAITPDKPSSGFNKVHTDPLMGKSDRQVISFRFPSQQSRIKEVYVTEFDPIWTCNSDDVQGAAERTKQQVDELLKA